MTSNEPISMVNVDLHPESRYWLEVVRQNIDWMAVNFKRDLNKLNKAMEKTSDKDIPDKLRDVQRCLLLREFIHKYHETLDSDVEILVNWAVRNGAEQDGDQQYIGCKNNFNEEMRK
jgi:hypothetical protein